VPYAHPVTNLATVQSIYEAFGKGDIPAILDVLADDVEWEAWADNSSVKAGVPWMVPRHGKAEAAKFFEAAGQMKITDLQVLNMMEGGNQVAVEFILETDLPAWGGGHYRDEEIHLWTFNDEGKVTRLRHYTDTAKHIAAYNGAK
jgi:ketosteroid isomerase-like protein